MLCENAIPEKMQDIYEKNIGGNSMEEGLFSKITDPKVQEMLLKQIRALV